MSKTVQEFQAKRVVFDTSLSFDEVTTRLNHELNRDKGGPKLFQLLGTVKTRDELERGMQDVNGGKDFAFFAALAHHNWRDAYYNQTTDVSESVQYILGNPLIAETMMRHDAYVGLNVPPRVLVVEKADKSGTQVVYLQPSSIIAIPVDGEVDREFVAAAQALDTKLEALIKTVTST